MDDTGLDPHFTKFFKLAKFMYFYMPLNPYSRFLKQMSKRQLLIGRGVYYFVLFSQLLLITLYFLYILESLMDGKDGDFLRSSASYVWLILAMNSYFITWNIFASGPKVAELIAVLCESFPKTKEERNDLEVEPFTNKFLDMMAALKFVFGGTVVVMTLSQILRSVLILLWTGQWKPEMPLSIWLPFDPKMIAAYPFAYVGECWLFLCNCCILVAFEATMGGVILLICLQFRKVQFRFRTLNFGDYKTDLKGMIEVINLHNRTLDLAEKARQTFSISLFIIFLFSAMVICVFTFLMFTEKDPIINFQYFVNLACFLVYVVLYAYYGDQLFDYSADVAEAMYDSNWLDADVRIRRMVVLVIQRSNVPLILNGMGFFYACIPTMSKILATSYSYFALLKSIYNSMQ